MKIMRILEDLIKIPSYPWKTEEDGKKQKGKDYESRGEEVLANYIEDFLRKYCPCLSIVKQPVYGKRYNIIAYDEKPDESNLMFFCHLDTVNPGKGQINENGIVFECDGEKIKGLGSADMKGGMAALLYALANIHGRTSGLILVFYCDEEFNFLGMKKILEEKNFSSKLAIFCEPTDLKIANGCRGLIEFTGYVEGITAHGSRPDKGLNAILLSAGSFEVFKTKVMQYGNQHLGSSDCNLAAITGGIVDRNDDNEVKFDKEGNVIIIRRANKVPDIADVLLEVRTANLELDAERAVSIYEEIVQGKGGKFILKKIAHDYQPFSNDRKNLVVIEEAIQKAILSPIYLNASTVGYYDAQMFNAKFGIPCICFGPELNETSHCSDEFTTLYSLVKTAEVYANIMKLYGIT